jgi:outer membrane protein
MHLYATRVFEDVEMTPSGDGKQSRKTRKQSGSRLRAVAAVMLTLMAGVPSGFAQEQTVLGAGQKTPNKAASDLPPAPAPVMTQPLDLRPGQRDFSKPAARFWSSPLGTFKPTSIPKASFANSVRLTDLAKDGKIYLSLSDAIALALENNYDLAIARYDLDIADTDILRTRTGQVPLGVPTGLVTGTLSGSTSTLSAGGGPGGTTVGSGGAGSGASGLTLTTAGAGPTPENLEPYISSNLQFDRASAPSTSFFTGGTSTTNTYNVGYNQGFVTGTNLAVTFDNTYATSTNGVTEFSPQFNSSFKAQLTQHILQGAGIWVNKRFIYQAENDRRIADSGFRQQILYTVNQVESIYWSLVQAYEDVQSKQRAVDQSSQVASDNRKQLQIGTMAPLDVVNADQSVASDKQALISSQLALNYQQQIIKQAIARNLNDPMLSKASVVPTDRVSIAEIPEEKQAVEDLVQQAFQQRPELEQAVLTLRNDEITLRGAKNALLPTIDIFAYLAGQGIAGKINPDLDQAFYCTTDPTTGAVTCPTGTGGYGTAVGNAFNDSSPDKGVGFTINIPLGNKLAQSVQARSLMEYRQAELRLEQLYTQIRMQVVNQQFALTNDRAQVLASQAARDYNQQSLDAEQKKLHLGASTTALVLQQQRSLAASEDSQIAAEAQYAKDRATLYQILATTMQHYGVNLNDAVTGDVKTAPLIPGITAAPPSKEPSIEPPSTPPAETPAPAAPPNQ